VKDSGGRRVGPRDNYFARASVSAGTDGVRLKARVNDGRLECAEIVLSPDLSYGTYRFEVATDLSRLASSLTLGMFLWSDSDDFAHREIDIEDGRWGHPQNDDMQFVVQPDAAPGNMLRFSLGRFRGHRRTPSPGRRAESPSKQRTAAWWSATLLSNAACRRLVAVSMCESISGIRLHR
jgi:hypothetical protein